MKITIKTIQQRGSQTQLLALYMGEVLGKKYFSRAALERGDVRLWAQELLRQRRKDEDTRRRQSVGYKEKHWSPDEFAFARRKSGVAIVETA